MKTILLLASFPLVGCAELHALHGQNQIVGSGKEKTETRTVGTYTGIELSGALEATFVEGSGGPVKITADDNLLKHIKTVVKNGVLHIYSEGSISTKRSIRVSGSAASIKSLGLSGACNLKFSTKAAHALKVDSSGASIIKVAGPIGDLDIELSGASQLTLPKANVSSVIADLSGASILTAPIHAQKAKIDASGASVVSGMTADDADVDATGASTVSVKAK